MFFIRAAFWLGLAVMLLPSDERRQAELYGKAVSAVQWSVTFCERNGALCEKSAVVWASFRQKAEFGGRMLVDLVDKTAKGRLEPIVVPSADPPATEQPAVEQAKHRTVAAK